jgi:hypothetical protein
MSAIYVASMLMGYYFFKYPQVDSNASLAAAVGYLSLLLGRQFPKSFCFHGSASRVGDVSSCAVTKGTLRAARAAGITDIFVDGRQVNGWRSADGSP